jgi:hypothetical protein
MAFYGRSHLLERDNRPTFLTIHFKLHDNILQIDKLGLVLIFRIRVPDEPFIVKQMERTGMIKRQP